MDRNSRVVMARQTVAICESGTYIGPTGVTVHISEALERAKRGTILCTPENWPSCRQGDSARSTRISVRNETTFSALARLSSLGGHIACLNFASAKNPG